LCGAEVSVEYQCNGGKIVVINGTSGSGKSTVAEVLVRKGFLAIDGDCVIQTVRHKTGKKQYEWGDLIDEIAREIDLLSLFCENITLSHVILPEDLDRYIEIFESRNMQYKVFLLKPDYQIAVERCQTRTCHTSVTPEYWIKHFYDLLIFDDSVLNVDNTYMTPEETANYILERI
jgi:adenylate kinase family enzyme